MLSISKLLKKTGHQIFMNMLTVMWVSGGWSLFIVPVVFLLPLPWAIVFIALTFVPATVAVYAVMNHVLQRNKAKLILFPRYFFYYFKRSCLMGIIYCVAVLIPISEWWYYATINNSYLVFVFAIFQTYLCLTFLATQVYAIPFLVQEDLSVFKAMNQSIKHFMKHTWYTIGLFIQILSVTALLSITVIGFFLLYIGMMAVFVLNATTNLHLEKKKDSVFEGKEQPTTT
ncbi:YesL family protein [Lederbergia lenta]|uniref:Predicted integral membrane protein n=1 Tax=Lederbergia lenta TaxID=1467 RepID=A0A2X4WEW3_LEDLE|nr:hypothetical protein [Lederbergia lenta]MCM3112183.1 hypothetical protein [Lederbergia lenta]MEC2323350.1 hypothetical protein [Lederbergia lenta]SQI63267.1 Predicted integral membrane protein [Lederbergia lenta]